MGSWTSHSGIVPLVLSSAEEIFIIFGVDVKF
jgi:hypothetical protein